MSYGKRYFFSFNGIDTGLTSDQGDRFICEIHKKDYAGDADELQAQYNPVTITYNNSNKDKLLPLRASSINIGLIADETFSLADLYTEDERQWLVKVFRQQLAPTAISSYLLWQGFILPELCEEEFTFTPYVLDAVGTCGLGILKNLSFVQEDGLHFTGMMSFKDVIWNCLNRLQLPGMVLNTAVNIYWDGLTPADATDPLAETFVSTERYFKDEELTPMTCEDVLKSVLEEWTACIVQMDGDWYVYRPNELALSGSVTFRQYSASTGAYTGTETLTINKTLGGSSEGELIYHENRNQRKSIARPFKNATMSYKYGTMRNLSEELDNPDLSGASQGCGGDPIGPCASVTIPGWTKTGTMQAGLYPTGGVIFYDDSPVNTSNYYENDNVFAIDLGFRLRLKVDYVNPDPLFNSDMNFQIIWNDGIEEWHLQADNTWAFQLPFVDSYTSRSVTGASGTLTIESQAVFTSGTITIRILAPSTTNRNIVYTNISAQVFTDPGIQVGDIFIVTQAGTFTNVPDIINVLNGDGPEVVYTGAIYKNDETTLTTVWNRRGISESVLSTPYDVSKPFLRIAVEEILRLHQRPMSVYDGTVAGFFQYITRFAINDLTGVYLPLQLTYNLQEGSIDTTLAEVANDELSNDFELRPDYGSVTKVSINGTP